MGAHNGWLPGRLAGEKEWEWELLEFSMPLAMTAAAARAGNAPLTAKKPLSLSLLLKA